MTAATEFLDRLPIPILQAPMVGAAGVEMTAAVSGAGALGCLGAGALSPEEIEAAAAAIRARTGAPFVLNLFVVAPAAPSAEAVDAAIARLAPWYAELGLPPPEAPKAYAPDFDAQFAALLRARPAAASFTFAALRADQAAALKAAGVLVIGTATTAAEGRAWAEIGADAVCAQGVEAGGHRGHFLAETESSLVGNMALVATLKQAVEVPVIAAGGIMDGAGVAAALALGASAAQMGTAFLLADESTVSAPWRRELAEAGDRPTRLTRALTGRPARGLETRFMHEMRRVEGDVPAYPVQNRLTQPLRAAAAAADRPDLLSLWAGQGAALARTGPAAELVRRWWTEARAASERLSRRTGI